MNSKECEKQLKSLIIHYQNGGLDFNATDIKAIEHLLLENEMQHNTITKQKEIINKAIDCINNSIFGYSDWECQKPLYLKDDDVGKELLSILEGKEVE